MTTAPLPSYGIWDTNIDGKRIMGFTPEQFLSVWQARADLEAENKRLRDLLGKANALARIRFEHIRRLEGRSANEDNSDCHGPDWTDRESEYLK